MEVKIAVLAANSAVADVTLAQLLDETSAIEGVEVRGADQSSEEGKIARFGLMELLATFITSAAAYQLALAVRDVAQKQSVEVVLTEPSGRSMTISAKGGDLASASEIVGFLVQQPNLMQQPENIGRIQLNSTEVIEGEVQEIRKLPE